MNSDGYSSKSSSSQDSEETEFNNDEPKSKDETIEKKMRKKCIMHPNHTFHSFWDAFSTIALVLTCLITPYQLAFYSHYNNEPEELEMLNQVIDVIFLFDIMISFNTSYFDFHLNVFSTDRKAIAMNYLKTWFAIDIIAIFPFEKLLYVIFAGQNDGIADVSRIAKFARFYRAIKLFRLVKMSKLAKERSKLKQRMQSRPHISAAFERLFLFFCVCIVFVHTLACSWVWLAYES